MRLVNLDGTPVGVGGEWVNGILMRVAPASSDFNLEIQRADITGSTISASSQLSDGQFNTIAILPPDEVRMEGTLYTDTPAAKRDTAYWYRFRHTRTDVTESQWLTDDNSHTPQTISQAALNTFGTTQAAFVGTTLDKEGTTLNRFTQQFDGVSKLSLTIGTQTGFASHSEAITFNPAFVGSPTVVFQGGISQQTESLWGTLAQVNAGTAASLPNGTKAQYDIYGADGLTETGFTTTAVLSQLQTNTFVKDIFQYESKPTVSVPLYNGPNSFLGYFLPPSGTIVSCSISSATTNESGQYTVYFTSSVAMYQTWVPPSGVSLTTYYVVEVNNGSGWSNRGGKYHGHVCPVKDTYYYDNDIDFISFTDTSLTNSDLVRVRLTWISMLPTVVVPDVWPRGGSLEYYTSAGWQYASKTDISTQVIWTAYGLQ